MAITIESPKEKQYGILKQTTWGTAATEGTSVIQIDTPGLTINPDVKTIERNLSLGTRRPYISEIINHTNRSAPLISIPAIEAKQDLLDYFLYLVTQTVTEGGTTPFSKTFTIPSTQPDFTANAGMFATFWERFADASTSRVAKDLICKSLTLSCNPGEPLMMSAELIGRGAVTEDATPAATWTRPSDSFWYWEGIDVATLNWGAGLIDLNLQGFEVTLSHAAIPYGNDGAGDFETFAMTNWDLGFKLKIGEDATQDIRTNFFVALKAATNIAFRIGWGNASPGTVDGDLDLAWNGRVTNVTPHFEDVLGIDVEGKILTTAVGTSPITIIMANALDRTW